MWRYDPDTRPRVDSAIAEHTRGAAVHELTSGADLRGFPASLG